MSPELSLPIPSPLLVRLITALESAGDSRDLGTLVVSLLEGWLARTAEEGAAASRLAKKQPADDSGYLWKEVFLPNGTQLLVAGGIRAEVRNGELLHRGRPTSPNRLAENVRGLQSRNAWRAVSVQRPGDPGFQRAWRLRREATCKPRPAPSAPPDMLPPRGAVADRRADQHPLDRYSAPFDDAPPWRGSGGGRALAASQVPPEATMIASRERRKRHARRCTDTLLDD